VNRNTLVFYFEGGHVFCLVVSVFHFEGGHVFCLEVSVFYFEGGHVFCLEVSVFYFEGGHVFCLWSSRQEAQADLLVPRRAAGGSGSRCSPADGVLGGGAYLVDDVDPVVQLLSLQDGVQVEEPKLQVLLPPPEGDDDGHLGPRHAVSGPVAPPQLQGGVLPLHLRQVHWTDELHPQRTH